MISLVFDCCLGLFFSFYFYHWKSSIPRNKSFLCFIATGLGFMNLVVYNRKIYTEPQISHYGKGNLVDFTNSYMKMYLISDLMSMFLTKTIRKDMLIHHSLTITAFICKNNLGMAFTPCAEMISMWEYCLPSSSKWQLKMRMVSISTVRLFVWVSLIVMLKTATEMTHWSDHCFCIVVPMFMIPMDIFWFMKCMKKLFSV